MNYIVVENKPKYIEYFQFVPMDPFIAYGKEMFEHTCDGEMTMQFLIHHINTHIKYNYKNLYKKRTKELIIHILVMVNVEYKIYLVMKC